ncbi:MAG TPA: aminotransferase class V-fold PLP-dependent enzyme [Terriglobia bacterium]|nr:aminotransferase class V-fold PLP-dependent enzyme [Terriglobia bacterium]
MALRPNEKSGICGVCSAGCGVIVAYDEKGRMVAVRPDNDSPFGMMCKVGERSPEIVYSKDRILYPMRRNGPKGRHDFKRISWDEAYDEIVAKLNLVKDESGPEAAAIYTGSGSFDRPLCDVYQPAGVAVSSASSVLFPFGSPNTLGVGALCYVAFAMIAPHVTMGSMYIDMFSDIEHAKLIVIWGKNPAAHCPPDDFLRIQEAHKRGARIVVIDPRKTAMARYPNAEWIPIRPGTDGALALGMCNVLIEEELYDEKFVKSWVAGFDEFNDYVQHFRPEYVESVTGVPAETVHSLAIRLAESDGAAPVMYSGLEYNGNGVQTIRAILALWALAGQLDVPGGQCFKMKQNKFPINRSGLVSNPNPHKAAGHNSFPLYSKYRGEFHAIALPNAVLEKDPYHIRMLISLGASIITSWPESAVWRKTLNGLDFLVCIDRQRTADMDYADIILPAATYYEVESYMVYDSMFKVRERLIEPVGEARYDFFIMAELARRLGYGHLYPQNGDELLSYVLAGSGFTPSEVRDAGGMVQVPQVMMQYKKWEKGLLREDGRPGFATPSGKFEIASSVLEEYGYDPLPRYVEPKESPSSIPELAKRFPLIFNSGARHNVDLHTLHQSIPSLAEERPVPTVMMNPADAGKRGINGGDKVLIKTPRGQVSMYAVVTDGIVKGAIEASGAGGGRLGSPDWQEACVNELTDLNNYDPISGFPAYKALLCDVTKVEGSTFDRVSNTGEYVLDSKVEEETRSTRIYLDNNATTALNVEVQHTMAEFAKCYGNPSSIHGPGKESRDAVEAARKSLALLINCTPRRLIFNSGGSEGNNSVIKGVALSRADSKYHIVTSSIEHPSVINACQWLEGRGFTVTYLPVDRRGCVNPEQLSDALGEKTCLVSIMAANNETGSIQPIRELAQIARERGVLFHTDAVQAVGKIPVDVQAWGVDFLTLSGHKFRGPKGSGAVYVRKGVELAPLIHGGKQEAGLRGGTENTLGIIGMGRAARIAAQHLDEMQTRVRRLRDRLYEGVLRIVPGTRLNGDPQNRLPNTLNVTIPGIRGESLLLALDAHGIFFSSGSACKSGSPEPSHVLLAMGLTEEEAHCALRFSLGMDNSDEDIERTLQLLGDVINTSIQNVRFVSCR